MHLRPNNHCIAFIAQNLKDYKDFKDEDMDKYLVVDSHVKELKLMTATAILRMIYTDALSYEGKDATEGELHEAWE